VLLTEDNNKHALLRNTHVQETYLLMALIRSGVSEFIRAGRSLLQMKNLSEEEAQAIRDMLWQLSIRFPDEGDDAAD
jgi:hypothetical protein